jgi:hypothetical protein
MMIPAVLDVALVMPFLEKGICMIDMLIRPAEEGCRLIVQFATGTHKQAESS